MRMEDPIPTFTYLIEQFKEKHPDLAYIHVVSPGATLNVGPEDPSVSIDKTRMQKHLVHGPLASRLYP